MLTMLIDHIGIVWFPDSPVWRIVGRLAFPIYTWYVALGMSRTRSLPNYIRRLAWLALASQIPFSLLFNTWDVNVIGTFAVSVFALYWMEKMPRNNPLRYLIPAAAAVLMEWIGFDYGAYGLLLLAVYRYAEGIAIPALHFMLNIAYLLWHPAPIQMFSIAPSLVFASPGAVRPLDRPPVPRWLWRSFYPVHLAALYILAAVIP